MALEIMKWIFSRFGLILSSVNIMRCSHGSREEVTWFHRSDDCQFLKKKALCVLYFHTVHKWRRLVPYIKKVYRPGSAQTICYDTTEREREREISEHTVWNIKLLTESILHRDISGIMRICFLSASSCSHWHDTYGHIASPALTDTHACERVCLWSRRWQLNHMINVSLSFLTWTHLHGLFTAWLTEAPPPREAEWEWQRVGHRKT